MPDVPKHPHDRHHQGTRFVRQWLCLQAITLQGEPRRVRRAQHGVKGLGYEAGAHASSRQKTASRSANLVLRGCCSPTALFAGNNAPRQTEEEEHRAQHGVKGLGYEAGGHASSRQKTAPRSANLVLRGCCSPTALFAGNNAPRQTEEEEHRAQHGVKGLGYEAGAHASSRQKTALRSANLVLRGCVQYIATSSYVSTNIYSKTGSLKWPTKKDPPLPNGKGGSFLVGHQGLEPWTNRL